jgi:hypothetical protein
MSGIGKPRRHWKTIPIEISSRTKWSIDRGYDHIDIKRALTLTEGYMPRKEQLTENK